jgi:hypothetical protein
MFCRVYVFVPDEHLSMLHWMPRSQCEVSLDLDMFLAQKHVCPVGCSARHVCVACLTTRSWPHKGPPNARVQDLLVTDKWFLRERTRSHSVAPARER